MSAPYLVTGVTTQDVYPRLEIRRLQKNEMEFTLFILGWAEIRKPGYRPLAAQFEQIGGIHGMPYVPWPGDPDEALQTVRGTWLGYCNHASIMFPTWHRPCVMLLEQAISEAAQGIAGDFAEKHPEEADLWLQAARQLRFPFWDWTHPSTGKEGLPTIFSDPELTLLYPGGEYQKHENMLKCYRFNNYIDGFNDRLEYKDIYDARDPNKQPDTIAYFKQWKRTYRHPSAHPINPTENIEEINAELTAQGEDTVGSWANLRSNVAHMFCFPLDLSPDLYANAWDEFSNTRFQSSRPDKDPKKPKHSPFIWNCTPIEQPHNNVHLVIGGSGHMADNDTAGFDPIFYLHHCNVDRLFAFWEHIYPDYVAGTEGYLDVDGMTRQPFTQVDGTFIETGTQAVDGETPLMPFRKSDYTYWTSNDTHSLHNDGDDAVKNKYYTYRPIAGVELDPKDPPSLKERERQRGALQRYFGYNPHEAVKGTALVEQKLYASVSSRGGLSDVRGLRAVPNYRQFIITTSLSQSHFNGSYTLKLYIESNQKQLHIGSVSVLGRGKSTQCGNCQGRRATGARVHGVIAIPHVPLVEALRTLGRTTADTTHSELIEGIKLSLRPKLVLPSGQVHSEPTGESEGKFLPDEAAPSLRLLSCDVYHGIPGQDLEETDEERLQSESSFHFGEWEDHELLEWGPWIKRVKE